MLAATRPLDTRITISSHGAYPRTRMQAFTMRSCICIYVQRHLVSVMAVKSPQYMSVGRWCETEQGPTDVLERQHRLGRLREIFTRHRGDVTVIGPANRNTNSFRRLTIQDGGDKFNKISTWSSTVTSWVCSDRSWTVRRKIYDLSCAAVRVMERRQLMIGWNESCTWARAAIVERHCAHYIRPRPTDRRLQQTIKAKLVSSVGSVNENSN